MYEQAFAVARGTLGCCEDTPFSFLTPSLDASGWLLDTVLIFRIYQNYPYFFLLSKLYKQRWGRPLSFFKARRGHLKNGVLTWTEEVGSDFTASAAPVVLSSLGPHL